jgi:hypothetical protein
MASAAEPLRLYYLYSVSESNKAIGVVPIGFTDYFSFAESVYEV